MPIFDLAVFFGGDGQPPYGRYLLVPKIPSTMYCDLSTAPGIDGHQHEGLIDLLRIRAVFDCIYCKDLCCP